MVEKKVIAAIVGTPYYPGAGSLIERLRPGNPLRLARQPNNPYDKNAVGVYWGDRQLGHVPRDLAATLAPILDAGTPMTVRTAAKPYVIQIEWSEPDVNVQPATP